MTEGEVSENDFGRIPVRNIWLLMLYASEARHLQTHSKVQLDENPDEIPTLIGQIFSEAVERRLKQNLSQSYVTQTGELYRLRGRANLLKTERKQLLQRGKISCSFTELTYDTPRNRFIKAALGTLAKVLSDSTVKRKCLHLRRTMDFQGVHDEVPTLFELSKDRFGRHDSDDKHLIELAKLAFSMRIPTEDKGDTKFVSPEQADTWIRKLFEKAVTGLLNYTLPQDTYRIFAGKQLKWPVTNASEGMSSILPQMRTDIVVDSLTRGRRLVIDTKFNPLLVKGWYRDQTLRSAYLYQMYAYLRSQETIGDHLDRNSSGLLLHPTTNGSIFEWVEFENHKVFFANVDLTQPTLHMKSELLQVISKALSEEQLPISLVA